jgi:hypothetical protein
MRQNWGGFKLQWEPVWDIFGLMDEARKLAPRSFTDHFSDHRIAFDEYGCRITGVAAGTGDVPMREACQVIKVNPNMKRLNIEVEFDPGADGREEARRCEYQAGVDSIRFVREELAVGREPEI